MAKPNLKRNILPEIHKKSRQQLSAISRSQPFSTNQPHTTVPPPQSARIMQRYVDGQSIREIARQENRDRATVTKIVRSEEMSAYVQTLRDGYYALGSYALAAVEHAVRTKKDARIGYRILADIGVIPSTEVKRQIAYQAETIDKSTLTPFELAMSEDEEGGIDRVAFGAACVMEESAENFGTSLPTPAQIVQFRKHHYGDDEITARRYRKLLVSCGAEK